MSLLNKNNYGNVYENERSKRKNYQTENTKKINSFE